MDRTETLLNLNSAALCFSSSAIAAISLDSPVISASNLSNLFLAISASFKTSLFSRSKLLSGNSIFSGILNMRLLQCCNCLFLTGLSILQTLSKSIHRFFNFSLQSQLCFLFSSSFLSIGYSYSRKM